MQFLTAFLLLFVFISSASVVNSDGATFILAASIIAGDEDGEKFSWVFEKFKAAFNEPAVIITDSCQKIAIGIAENLSNSTHLLCAWHIYKNLVDHIHSLVSAEDWTQIVKLFWRLAKETDSRRQHSFDDEYAAFVKRIEASASSHCETEKKKKLLHNAMNWLRGTLFEKRHSWAYRFSWRHFTAGCHSTQRAEAIHSAAKVCFN